VAVQIRPLEERDLGEADRIFRVAFGTFLRVPDPSTTFGDADFARTRFAAAPDSAFAAELDGKFVGSNFLARWGSFGFFGPLTVEPALWEQKIAQRLLERTMEQFDLWRCRHTGLFTFSHSPKHIALYQKFGYWAGALTPVMSKPPGLTSDRPRYKLLSELGAGEKEQAIEDCRALTGSIFEGLDLAIEIRSVDAQKLGDTVLLYDGSQLRAFAICHVGRGTEAGSGTCYVKFGAARPGAAASEDFERLLDACEAYAGQRQAKRLSLGVNMARHGAYAALVGRKFRTDLVGVAMQKANAPGFNRPDVYVLDDWR